MGRAACACRCGRSRWRPESRRCRCTTAAARGPRTCRPGCRRCASRGFSRAAMWTASAMRVGPSSAPEPGRGVTQLHYARRGEVTPEMEFIAIREGLPADFVRVRGRARPRDHSGQHQSPRTRADDHRPQLPGEDQRQHRQLGGRLRRSTRKSTSCGGRRCGAPTRSWTCPPAGTSTRRASGSSATPPCRSAPSRSTRRSRRSAGDPRI